MNLMRQRLITLKTRARALQTALRRWALYADQASPELREGLLTRMTPVERAQLDRSTEVMRERLRPVAVHVDTFRRWLDFVMDNVNDRFDDARRLIDQGRAAECLAILNDIEQRLLLPNAAPVSVFNRCLQQRCGHDYFQKIVALDTLIRDLYLPSAKAAVERGILPKPALIRTPIAFLVESPEELHAWRAHRRLAAASGRFLPISLLGVPRQEISDPWNLIPIAHEVGLELYDDLALGFELSHKLLRESIQANISPATAAIWSRWHETLFGDVFGTLRMGSAYVSGMIELMGADPRLAVAGWPDGPVPPAYLRWHVMLQTVQLLGLPDEARTLFGRIHSVCGDPTQLAQVFGPVWLQLIGEARAVAGLIAYTPWQKLNGARVIDVVPPLLSSETEQAQRVKDLLLASDERCAGDEAVRWADPIADVPAHLVLAGLRLAFDATEDLDASRRLWIAFWCLMQRLTLDAVPLREKEDREVAPDDDALRLLAQRMVPASA
ncbi:MAG: hypothetical protein L6Q92_09740 [Phycisphaerae bacterium]|nr:hypothetical protein [Phycisphaerae bacterium]